MLQHGIDENDWLSSGLETDLRSRMKEIQKKGQTFVLATLVEAYGGPRPVGSQMIITEHTSFGFVSGGCVEADIRLHGRDTIKDGRVRKLVYGRGSPYADIRLPCDGSLTIVLERILPDDPVVAALDQAAETRQPILYLSDGVMRVAKVEEGHFTFAPVIRRLYTPQQRLVVVGDDAFAWAMAGLARQIDWAVTLVRPNGPTTPPQVDVDYRTEGVDEALTALNLDPWTAVAVASHDETLEDRAVEIALMRNAGYVGVLGSRHRIESRRKRLLAHGVDSASLTRLKAPIGLAIGASSPWEVAVAVLAEIISDARL